MKKIFWCELILADPVHLDADAINRLDVQYNGGMCTKPLKLETKIPVL